MILQDGTLGCSAHILCYRTFPVFYFHACWEAADDGSVPGRCHHVGHLDNGVPDFGRAILARVGIWGVLLFLSNKINLKKLNDIGAWQDLCTSRTQKCKTITVPWSMVLCYGSLGSWLRPHSVMCVQHESSLRLK